MEKIKGQLESYKEQPFSLVLRFLMWIATFLTVGITVCIVGYILIRGIPNLSPEMFAWEYNTMCFISCIFFVYRCVFKSAQLSECLYCRCFRLLHLR